MLTVSDGSLLSLVAARLGAKQVSLVYMDHSIINQMNERKRERESVSL